MKSISKTYKHGYLIILVVAMLFPWVQFIFKSDSDVQPYSLFLLIPVTLVLAVSFFFNGDYKVSKIGVNSLLAAFSGMLVALIILSIDGLNLESLRASYQYIYAAIFFMALFFVSGKKKPSLENLYYLNKIIAATFWVWVFVGLYQRFIDKEFLVHLLNRSVVTADRGVVSLSSEPAYFGLVMLFYSLVFFIFNRKILGITSLILMVFLTMSSVSIVVLLASLFVFYLHRGKLLSLVFIPLFALFIYYLGLWVISASWLSEYRVVQLIERVYSNAALLFMDGSLNIRLSHFYYSHHGFINDFLIPHGALEWPNYISRNIGSVHFLWDTGLNQTSRINSGIGGMLFEGGVFSLIFIFFALRSFYLLAEHRGEASVIILLVMISLYAGFTFKSPHVYLLIYLFYLRFLYKGSLKVRGSVS